jgi:hypothetical protein
MTRIAIIPTLTDGKAGLWSTSRSEGRIPLNWGALLGANGYEVVVVSQAPDFAECLIPGVTFAGPDEVGDVDWVLFGTTSVLGSNWYGRSSVRTKRVVRLQWPTGARIDASGDILAVAHPCYADQVADEAGVPRESIHVLPSPTLPLDWWEMASGRMQSARPTKDIIVWAARDAFIGSQGPCGEAALAALEQSTALRGMPLVVLSIEQHRPQEARFVARGAVLTSGLHLGDVMRVMRRGVLCVTTPAFMGPTLTEAIFEDCAPLVWRSYRALFPELVAAAEKHGVLLDSPGDVRGVMERLLSDWALRAAFVDSCKFAFAEKSPAKCLGKWKFMEGRIG